MTAWMMSIVGVICLGVLLEIVLPDGKTAKYVRGAFSLLVIFVIISPLPAFFKKDLAVDLDLPVYETDDAFKQEAYASYAEGLARRAEEGLAEEGYGGRVEVLLEEGRVARVRVWMTGDFEGADEVVARVLHISRDKVILLNAAAEYA